MKDNYEILFTPWKIGNVEIKNRIVMTSMGGTSIFGWMEPNHFDDEAAKFLLERAKNNVGLILPGIAPIKDILFGKWLFQGKQKFKKLKSFMEEFHKTGSKLFIQLTAGFGRSLAINDLMIKANHNKFLGTILKSIINVDYLTASASRTPNRWDDSCYSRPLTKKEINEMIAAFAKTAKLCMDAGVDGVEVHAVHEGYLLDQFTLPYTNKRTDEYGGSFEGRYRFPVEIVKAIKKACGKDFPVSLRYSVISKTKGFGEGALPNENYTEVGRTMEESIKAAKYLQDAGYDMLNCDNGTYDAWYWSHPGPYMPENCNLIDAIELKKHVSIPIVCAGRMNIDKASLAIKNNEIDAVGIARPFLVDPEWVTKLLNDDMNSIKPCICCHNGCFNMAHYNGVGNDQSLKDNAGMSRCALNPKTMQSKKYKIIPTKHKKNIAIIGAGIGGMEAAIVLTKRGHNVTIYEKSDKVGGIYNAAAAMSFKEKDKELLEWYKRQIANLNIKIVFNKEITSLTDIEADEYIAATGSNPRKLNILGFEKAIEASFFLDKKPNLEGKVLIIGGGLTGCEIALELYNKGVTPIIVETKGDLMATRGICLANSSYLRDFFKLNNVEVHLNTQVLSINDTFVTVLENNETKKIETNAVISSVGYIPNKPFEKNKHLHYVGDSYEVGNLHTVIWRAWDVGMKL